MVSCAQPVVSPHLFPLSAPDDSLVPEVQAPNINNTEGAKKDEGRKESEEHVAINGDIAMEGEGDQTLPEENAEEGTHTCMMYERIPLLSPSESILFAYETKVKLCSFLKHISADCIMLASDFSLFFLQTSLFCLW